MQISRIQVRRGQKNVGTGVPQLASGEIGWAVDTRELFIGNGSVSEGAPAVGNTKILTQYDNLFTVADTYIYKDGLGTIETGGTGASAIQRTLQERLDDRVSGRSFGLTGEVSQVATEKLQTAIDQLYLNDATGGLPQSRVILHLEPGEYIIDDTIYIPPYATIVGAGADKTIIRSTTGLDQLFKTVNSSSTIGTPADKSSTTTLNQPKNITLKGFTIETTATGTKGLVLDCCKDSTFEDIKISGPWESSDALSTDEVGIELNNLSLVSSVVETRNNTFNNVTVNGFSYAISSDWDTNLNKFSRCTFYDLGYGIAFGTNLVTLDADVYSSKNYGPYDNSWQYCHFKDIDRHAVWVKFGEWNASLNNKFDSCGNDGGAEYLSQHSIIKYEKGTNRSEMDRFARTKVLGFTPGYWTSYNYHPEIEGSVICTFGERSIATIPATGYNGDGDPIYEKRFRLPAEPDIANQSYELDYTLVSTSYAAMRSGKLTITLDGYNKTVQVDDEYSFNGQSGDTYLDKIYFDATIETFAGEPSVIDVYVASQMPGDDNSQMEFFTKLKKTAIDASGE